MRLLWDKWDSQNCGLAAGSAYMFKDKSNAVFWALLVSIYVRTGMLSRTISLYAYVCSFVVVPRKHTHTYVF